jgi:FlaA1/EpsC-like NDP-sugar epimerase
MQRLQFIRHIAGFSPRKKWLLMASLDAVCLPLCVFASVLLRLGSFENALDTNLLAQFLLGWLTLPVLGVAGLYGMVLRYFDLRIVVACITALGGVVLAMFGLSLLTNAHILPHSSYLMYWFIAFSYVVSSRFLIRGLLHEALRRGARPRLRTAIYGAGEAGAQLAQAMQLSPDYEVVCFLDDGPELQRKTVVGLRVFSSENLQQVVFRHAVAQIVVALPSVSKVQRRELIVRLEQTGLPVKTLPGLVDFVSGNVVLADIREVEVADLLWRDVVPPDPALFARNLRDKVVLVTGAGGSIGSELCRQILAQKPKRLVLLDHSEFALYAIEQSLRARYPGAFIVARLGSVLDEEFLSTLLREQSVQTVYHAAAYKHVPLVEGNVEQGVLNNVFGTLALARAAVATKVQACVLVSTDKAVRPTNVMGATKRIAELVFQAQALRHGQTTRFSMVRFGNVLGSSGSVVPLFKQQIQRGGPITITHPDIIRYFMLIPEAAQLVIQAGAMAQGGELFVLDMGEPVRIVDLARSMIQLSGLSERTAAHPHGDIEIQYVGLRPGEKLFEELLIGDNVVPSSHPRIMCAAERCIEPILLDKMLAQLRIALQNHDGPGILRQIRNLVPEYAPSESRAAMVVPPAEVSCL